MQRHTKDDELDVNGLYVCATFGQSVEGGTD